jgi:hypothetical protein
MISPALTGELKSAKSFWTMPETCVPTWTVVTAFTVPVAFTVVLMTPRATGAVV